MSLLSPAASVEATLEIPQGICVISRSLDVEKITKFVQDDGAGAIALFIGLDLCPTLPSGSELTNVHSVGTTRNSFKGTYLSSLRLARHPSFCL